MRNNLDALSTRIKDAGIAIRHSRGRILFLTPPLIRPTAGWTGTFEAVERSRLLFGLVQSYLIDILIALVKHSI